MEQKFEVTFYELSEERQRLAFDLDSKEVSEELLRLGIKSQYKSIRLLVVNDIGTTSSILNEAIKKEESIKVIIAIWNNPNFEKTRENLKILSKASRYQIRRLVAEYEGTPSDILDDMLEIEKDEDVKYDISNNPNFEKTEKNLRILGKSIYFKNRLFVASCDESTSDILNDILKKEEYDVVIDKIWNNKNMDKSEENLEKMSKSINCRIRYWVAKYKGTPSYILDMMLRKETDIEILNAIKENPNYNNNIKNWIIMKIQLFILKT